MQPFSLLSIFFLTSILNQNAPQLGRPSVVDSWKLYSSVLIYDKGGRGVVSKSASRPLEIKNNGTWVYGNSSGKWDIQKITPPDWKIWQVNPFGPSRMIVLYGWSGATASGPIIEDSNNIDFIWVIYRSTTASGTVQMKFGRASL